MPSDRFPFSGPAVKIMSKVLGFFLPSTSTVPSYIAPIPSDWKRVPQMRIRAPPGAGIFCPSTSSEVTFHEPWSLSRSVIGILVDDEFEVSGVLALGLDFQHLTGAFVRT